MLSEYDEANRTISFTANKAPGYFFLGKYEFTANLKKVLSSRRLI